MKFSDGYWQVREGYQVSGAMDIRDTMVTEDALTVFAACKRVNRKGDTLNEPLLTVRYSSPMPDVIRVEWVHHAGIRNRGPEFQLANKAGFKPVVTNDEETATLKSGDLAVIVYKKEGWRSEYRYKGRRLTGTASRGPAHILDDGKRPYMREQLGLGVGEKIYGMGERFTPFVKNGQTVDIWNEDGGTSSEQAYKNVPFYLSNRSYGVFVNHPERVSFEVGSESVSRVQFSVPGESLNYYVIGGAAPKDVLNNYTNLTGKPALPPAWSFGLWLTTSFTTSYDEQTVNSFIDGMAERNLPLHVFHFDCFWMKEYQWCDFEWDKDVFPDPEGMLKRLKDRGLRICVWINPYIAQKSPLFAEGAVKGYLVKTPEGDVWQWDKWQAGMGLVDFTNPEATAWYQSKLKRLMDMGVDCFKTDFGERIPVDVVYHDGSDPQKMHNYYTHLYNKAVFDVLEAGRGKNEAMLFARSATAGGQQFPVHWGGDCSANYDSMAETLRGGLSLGLSGFGFWSHDISGFERTAPADVYKRWVAFGLLSSHSRLHGNESYRVPWLFGDEAVDVLRHFTQLKSRLMPYLFGSAVESTQFGLPMARAMVLEFPDDPTCEPLDLQYMLGGSLLVAPIFNDEGTANYYLPAGRWTHLLSGAVAEGGHWRREPYDYFSLPLWVRPNSLIAFGANDQKPDYDYADGTEYHLFELEDGGTAESVIQDRGGKPVRTVTARRTGSTIRIESEGSDKPWSLVLRNVSGVRQVAGADQEQGGTGLKLKPQAGTGTIAIEL